MNYIRLSPLGVLCLLCLFPAMVAASEGGGHGGSEGSKAPLPPPAIPAPDNINTYLHTQLNSLTKAQAPRIQDRKIIFTYQNADQPRYVAIAFAHEAFRKKHIFYRNQFNVYFLVYDITAETPATIDYRYVVDGLWQSDPWNTKTLINDQGIRLSQVSFSTADRPTHASPVQKYHGELEFRYRGKPGLRIAVSGNFNHWDPFANYLEEEHPGEYVLTLTLPPGLILYQYVIGTRTILDPLNAHVAHDDTGAVYSQFENQHKIKALVMEASLPETESHGGH